MGLLKSASSLCMERISSLCTECMSSLCIFDTIKVLNVQPVNRGLYKCDVELAVYSYESTM